MNYNEDNSSQIDGQKHNEGMEIYVNSKLGRKQRKQSSQIAKKNWNNENRKRKDNAV